MLVKVDAEKVELELDELPFLSGEYNIHECKFQFSEEYNGLVKMCIFTKFGLTYQKEIVNDKCDIPYEVLNLDGKVIIGVYAYSINEEEIELRYSPRPTTFDIEEGSYRQSTEESGGLSPSEYEQLLYIITTSIEEIQNDYQLKLTPGEGIEINDNVISLTPGAGGKDYQPGRNIFIDDVIIGTDADPNEIESVYLNGEKQEPQGKKVDIEIESISPEDINDLFR